jgi:hypothetical protein
MRAACPSLLHSNSENHCKTVNPIATQENLDQAFRKEFPFFPQLVKRTPNGKDSPMANAFVQNAKTPGKFCLLL